MVAVRCQQEVQLLEDMPGAKMFPSKVPSHMPGKLVLAMWFLSIRSFPWGCPHHGSWLPQSDIQETKVETVVSLMTYPWKSHTTMGHVSIGDHLGRLAD